MGGQVGRRDLKILNKKTDYLQLNNNYVLYLVNNVIASMASLRHAHAKY